MVGALGRSDLSWWQRLRLALDEGVVEGKSEFSSQNFLGANFGHRQKEREPAWQEAILLLMRWTKDDFAILMVLEQILREWMKEVLEYSV